MGLVADYLIGQIERQVTAHHLVVWFDPGWQHAEIASERPATL
jgi:hypothetical protein